MSSIECSIEVPSSTFIIILHSNKKEERLAARQDRADSRKIVPD